MSPETSSPQEVFDQAIVAYNAKNYEEAIGLFKAIRDQGLSSADLELNLSKAYLKNNRPGEAILHAERGVFLSRWDSKAREDLAFIQKALPAGYGQNLDHPAEISWKMHSYIRGGEALFIGLLLILFGLSNAMLRSNFRGRISMSLITGGGFLLIWALATVPSKLLGTVVTEAELRSTPILSAESVMKLPIGTRLRVRQEAGNFVEVERPNSFRGWVPKENIARLIDPK